MNILDILRRHSDENHRLSPKDIIEILDEAIDKNRQLTFNYGDYGTDKKLHLRKNPDKKIKEYKN